MQHRFNLFQGLENGFFDLNEEISNIHLRQIIKQCDFPKKNPIFSIIVDKYIPVYRLVPQMRIDFIQEKSLHKINYFHVY